MTNLKKLDVGYISLLGDLSFPKSLQTIHVKNITGDLDLKRLENIRSKKLIPELTCDSIKYSAEFQKLPLSFISEKLKALLNEMKESTNGRWIEIKSSYNYVEESQMTPDCISKLNFHVGMSSITPAVHFSNLKVIKIKIFYFELCFIKLTS